MTSLMRIDAAPIREKARRQYERVLRDLEGARREVERFEQEDRPQFDQWMSRHFGAQLTRLRELGHQLQTQRDLLFEIQAEALVSDCSHVRAYERVMWRRQHPEENEFQPGAGADQEEQAPNGEQRRAQADDDEGPEGFWGPDPDFEPAPARAKRTALPRLKDVYRALVRRLHPDMQEKLTPQQREWWHQAQAAYREGDVEQLQVILTLCEIQEQGSTAQTSVGLLMRITREFRASLRGLRARIAGYKREPAWNFSNLRDRGALQRSTERLIQSEMTALRQTLDVVECQLASWARQARMTPRRGPRGRAVRMQQSFGF